ncbi:MAG: Rrf2 family transcriptional regulator [Clostridia bacterium]|nr:Rrf2 family transcriptional regulator [Clostridia bacterium]
MKISTRGRYAVRAMVDLAEHYGGEYIPLKDMAARQDISKKYLESIMSDLSKAGLIDGMHGKGGGYKLKKPPENYTVGDILRITEGDLAPVGCVGGQPCERAAQCRTISLWTGLYKLVNDYFDNITIADLMNKDGYDYII